MTGVQLSPTSNSYEKILLISNFLFCSFIFFTLSCPTPYKRKGLEKNITWKLALIQTGTALLSLHFNVSAYQEGTEPEAGVRVSMQTASHFIIKMQNQVQPLPTS